MLAAGLVVAQGVDVRPSSRPTVLLRDNFSQPHYVRTVSSTAFGAAKTLTDAATNMVLGSPLGIIQFREELAKTTSSWVDANGTLDITADNTTNDEGVEIALGDSVGGAGGWVVSRSATNGAGCFAVNFTIALIAGTDQFVIGWRKAEAFQDVAAYAGYADWSVVGINNVDGSIFSLGEVNGGGTLSDDSGVNAANGETHTLKSCIAATTGVPSAYLDGLPITMTNSGTAKTSAIAMYPFISYLQAGGAVDAGITINWMELTK